MPMKNPASAGRKQGSSVIVCCQARDFDRDTLNPAPPQLPLAARRLSQRFGLSVASAEAIAEANMWGRC